MGKRAVRTRKPSAVGMANRASGKRKSARLQAKLAPSSGSEPRGAQTETHPAVDGVKRARGKKKADQPRAETAAPKDPDVIEWTAQDVGTGQLVVWPGCTVKPSDEVETWFGTDLGVSVRVVGCVTTLTNSGEVYRDGDDSGGRIDFFFIVGAADVAKFALRRLAYGMRWWEDMCANGGADIYPPEFLAAYPAWRA